MAEDLNIVSGSKQEKYISITQQIEALITGEPDLTANLANIAAALKEQFGWFWVGFYMVKENATTGNSELVLGPFQGPVACTRIAKGKGVCGTSWAKEETIVVADVEKFPGHIACSSASKSEIVVPIFNGATVVGVLDVDSELLDQFDAVDQQYLEAIVALIQH
ncbi:MAG: GAF domain-containing protein [Sediminibacterium sp.]|jgi:GAF domain-containing protein|nr:GAF domain-containing protein [Sediminibacterium sp.]MBP7990589.1 GAF domain-containing protein [Sediminibacterium sp.]